MIYDLLKKDLEYNKNKDIFKYIDLVSKSVKPYAIGGGISLSIYYDKIYREHKDLDIYILKKDIDYWINLFKTYDNNLKVKNKYKASLCRIESKGLCLDLVCLNGEFDSKKSKIINFNAPSANPFYYITKFKEIDIINKYNVFILCPDIIKLTKINKSSRLKSKTNKHTQDLVYYI